MHKITLYTSFIGQENIILPMCQSTNAFAIDLCEKETPVEGTTIVTFNQTAGRGQRGNTWQSEAGKNLTLSVILKPDFLDLSKQFYLNIITSLAVYELLLPYLKNELKIKWPNDILCTDKKICGILIENSIRGSQLMYSVVGVGININQKKFDYPQASSLTNFSGQEHDLYELAAALLKLLEEHYLLLRNNSFDLLKKSYLQKLVGYGEERSYLLPDKQVISGKIIGVQEDGHLLLLTGNQVKSFDFKEISFIYE